MARYTHRIEIPATLIFDVDSDNEQPTVAEIRQVIEDNLIDGYEGVGVDTLENIGARVYPAMDQELDWDEKHLVCDTTEHTDNKEGQTT